MKYVKLFERFINEKDLISGGKADKLTTADIAKKFNVTLSDIENQVAMGVKVEIEHTGDKSLAREIALDHLTEFPDYYTRLIKMEKDAQFESNADVLEKIRLYKGSVSEFNSYWKNRIKNG